MKFFCEYCGNRIDAEKDHKCPYCGASYKKNKSFAKLEQERNKQTEINNEYKQKIFNHVFSTMKFSKWFIFIPIIIFTLVFSIFFFNFININKRFNTKSNEIKDEVDSLFDSVTDRFDKVLEKEQKPQKVTVNFNEFGETTDYRVKVEKYEVVEDTFNRLDEGYEYVKFHLIVQNLTNSELIKENVNCIVDGIAQTNKLSSGYSELPMFIASDLTVKGTATFIVSKEATSYDIRYGDYITIHIDK